MNSQELLSYNILLLRKEEKLTQTKLAEMAGITRKHLCAIEKGRVFPSSTIIDSIANALGVSPSLLFKEKDDTISSETELYTITERVLERTLLSIPSIFQTELKKECRKIK